MLQEKDFIANKIPVMMQAPENHKHWNNNKQ